MASEKKLYKKTSEKKICGVCAGLAEYLNMDVTVVRLLFVRSLSSLRDSRGFLSMS